MKPTVALSVGALLSMGLLLVDAPRAEACGCLSPPAVTAGEYAVNQSAEQLIFEVEPGWVTAHVLIKYAGSPDKFAWIVPVPEVPELGLSPVSAFGLLDQATAPQISVNVENICPTSAWTCAYHQQPQCGNGDGFGGGIVIADAGSSSDAPGGAPDGVTVVSQQVVGDYQTVTFRATEAAAATQWLRTNGFIVNQTTSVYMEPYVQAGMVFVAAKLLPGAGVNGIKPLKMRYRAAFPTVPLLLTAVAAEPHLTVTAFIYGAQPFKPMGHPVVTIDPSRLAKDPKGRLNYPMVLARTIDEAGGGAFAIEYRGGSVRPFLGQGSCCGSYDFCHVGGNQQCECPRDPFDHADCTAQGGDLPDGLALLDALAAKYPALTRITTRVSPEQMTFDPTFVSDPSAPWFWRQQLTTTQPSLAQCAERVIDQTRYAQLEATQGCAALYCGIAGRCVTTPSGPACLCGPETVAQQFLDLDGVPSVTCVPETPTVDLRAGGEQLPDACAGVSCGDGRCIDRNGIAVCECQAGAAALTGTTHPTCTSIELVTQTSGASDFSEPLRTLAVCAPPPPTCGAEGWLEKTGTKRPGVDCGNTEPAHALTVPGPEPHCDGLFAFTGCGCQQTSAPVSGVVMVWIVGLVALRRRRAGARR